MPQRVFHPIFKIGGLPIILYMNLHIKFLVAQNHIIHRIDIILRAAVQILFTLQFPVSNSITIKGLPQFTQALRRWTHIM